LAKQNSRFVNVLLYRFQIKTALHRLFTLRENKLLFHFVQHTFDLETVLFGENELSDRDYTEHDRQPFGARKMSKSNLSDSVTYRYYHLYAAKQTMINAFICTALIGWLLAYLSTNNIHFEKYADFFLLDKPKWSTVNTEQNGTRFDGRSYPAEFFNRRLLCIALIDSPSSPFTTGVTPLFRRSPIRSWKNDTASSRNFSYRNLSFESVEERTLLSSLPIDVIQPPIEAAAIVSSIVETSAVSAVATASAAAAAPQTPATFAVSYSLPTDGATYRPTNGTELQAAFNAVNPGDVIVLAAGTTYKGTFILPAAKPNPLGKFVYVISSDIASLKEGQRISPTTDAAHMPKLTFPDAANGNLWLLASNGNSSYWRFSGIEFVQPATGAYAKTGVMVTLGFKQTDAAHPTQSYWTKATSASDLPDHVWFDRCYIHSNIPVGTSDPDHYCVVGIEMSGTYLAVVDSNISNMRMGADESYAIHLYQGAGPFKIANNYLEAAGINFFSGGSDPTIQGSVPSDIEFRGNYVHKQAAWKSQNGFYSVKNLLELKNAQRVLIDGNIFDGNYGNTGNQYGNGIVITPRNQSGTAPWSKVTDVTFTNNIVENVAVAMQIASNDGNFSNPWLSRYSPDTRLQRLLVRNNAFINIDATLSGTASGFGFAYSNLSGSDWTFDHNLLLPGPNADTAAMSFAAQAYGLLVKPWVPNTAYNVYPNTGYDSFGDIVTFEGYVYMARAAHTSSTNLNADLAAGKWVQLPTGSNYLCNNFAFTNNLLAFGNYGFTSSGGMASATLNYYFNNWTFSNNGFIGRSGDASYSNYQNCPSYWAKDFNTSPMTASSWINGMAAVGFTNYLSGNYALASNSAYHNAGSDGKDLGPDWVSLLAATKNTQTGVAATATHAVVDRHLFYGGSAYQTTLLPDGADAAIAADKQALLPGSTATFANYSSYSRGINGLVVDIAGMADPTLFSLADLQFRVGNDNNPSAWSAAPSPTSVSVRRGAGINGSDRVTIAWADNAIANTWLQVTVKATAVTGLVRPDVFYFGNAIGETGNNAANAVVDSTDETLIGIFRTGFAPADITNAYDINRDRIVNAVDRYLARVYSTDAQLLQLITPGASASAGIQMAGSSPASESNTSSIIVGEDGYWDWRMPFDPRRMLPDGELDANMISDYLLADRLSREARELFFAGFPKNCGL
jgi:hypothetical protein